VLPKSTIITLVLGGIVIVGAIIAHRRGHLENKALVFAVGLILLLFVGYLLMGGFGES
jgi:hypothetical protein